MSDENNKVILDSQGNVLKNVRESKVKHFLKNNWANALENGLATCITIVGILNLMFSRNFANSCASFYGVDSKYFSRTEMFGDRLIFFFWAAVLFLYPFILAYLGEKISSKSNVILIFFAVTSILFLINLAYTIKLIDFAPYDCLKKFWGNSRWIIIYLAADIVIAYFLTIRKYLWKNKKYKKVERIFLTIALLVYLANTVVGVGIQLRYEISDEKSYEVIEGNRAIVSTYNDKFVVMDCEVQDDTIILKKGSYRLEEMTGVSITYHKYQEVVCE